MDRKKERGRAGGTAATSQLFSGFFLALSPDLVYFHKDEIIKVWDCVSECCRQDLLLKKRVGLMGLGTIHIMKKPIWHGEGEGFMADTPEFELNKPLPLVGKNLLHGQSPVPGISKADELVCAEVALRLHKPKATIVLCIKATLQICEWALSSGKNFDFVFKDIGVLLCRGKHVAMRFFEGLVREVAQLQGLAEGLQGLLQSPSLKLLSIAHLEKDISQIPPGGVFVLPHFVQADGNSQPHPLSALLQDSVTTSKTKTKHQTTPGNLPNHLLLRPHLPSSRIYDVKGTGREKKKADGGVQRGSLLGPSERSVKKGRATREMEEPKAGLAAATMQGRFAQLPALAEQRSLKKAGAFSSGGFERLRRERVAAVAGVAAALCPEGTQQEKAPSPRRRTPQPRTPRAKQVLLNLQPYRVSREQCMKALQMNQLRKWSHDESLGSGSNLSLVKKLSVDEETAAEL